MRALVGVNIPVLTPLQLRTVRELDIPLQYLKESDPGAGESLKLPRNYRNPDKYYPRTCKVANAIIKQYP